MQQIYKFKRSIHNYKQLKGLSYRVKNIQSWVLANPRTAINSLIIFATLIIFSTIIALISKHHVHSYSAKNTLQILTINTTSSSPIAQQTNDTIAAAPLTTIDQPLDSTSSIATNQIAVNTINTNKNPQLTTKNITIRNKDTLGKIFSRNSINQKMAKTILALNGANALRNLTVGQKITLDFTPDKQLTRITYPINATDTLTVSKNSNRFQAKIAHIEPVAHLQYGALIINGSVYASAKKVGVSSKLITQLMNIFSDKVNLNKTLRTGDKIAFLYKDYYIKNQKINKNSDILAAEYTHAGKINKIVAFTDSKGITNYYTPDGYSLKSPFLRYPVKFKRIGSQFSLRRYNPVLHAYYEHTGVDLDADSGTPIQASSDGVIASIGMNGDGYGNKIIIKHGQYSTLYAHMRGFASGLHNGSAVRQGQLIGYVGMTGRATGPHLHYEFRINNSPCDPMRVKLPSGEMIAKSSRGQFFAQEKKMFAQLDLYTKSLFAANTDVDSTTNS